MQRAARSIAAASDLRARRVAAAYTQNFARPASTRRLSIDAATGTLQQQNPPSDGVLTTLGRLDPTLVFGSTAGFDIVGGDDGLSLAVLQPTGATQSALYRVNPRTGAATAPGAVGPAGTAPLRAFASGCNRRVAPDGPW